MTTNLKPFFLFSVAFSALLYFFIAWNNQMHLHPDELFQIVEYASYKLHITPPADLSWEFHEKMRPAFQPFLAYLVFKGLAAVRIEDHFTHLFVLRFITACFSLSVVSLFCFSNLYWISEKYRKHYVLLTFLFWMPYLYGARFSSETWSGNFILLAVSVLLLSEQDKLKVRGKGGYQFFDKLVYALGGLLTSKGGTTTQQKTSLSGLEPKPAANWYAPRGNLLFFSIGVLLGLAFLCRFQAAFFAIGIVPWLMFIKKEKFSSILYLFAGGACVLLAGFIMDRWLYSEWVFTPWRYFESNIIKGMAGHFGTRPFYYYLLFLFLFPSPVIGALVLFSLGYFFYKYPRHLYTWLLLPFIIAHSVVGHKESRFIFPVINFLPVVAMLAYQSLNREQGLSFSKWKPALRYFIIACLLFFNFSFLSLIVLLANRFSTDPLCFAGRVHQLAIHRKVKIYYLDAHSHPFILPRATIEKDIYPEYLQEKNITNRQIHSYCELDSLPDNDTGRLIATNKYEAEHDSCFTQIKSKYKILMRSFPVWMEQLPIEKYFGKEAQSNFDRNLFYILEERGS